MTPHPSPSEDPRNVEKLIKRLFPASAVRYARVQGNISTYVYRVSIPGETFYLRILPEEGASFAPEVAVHSRLRQLGAQVPDVLYFDPYDHLLERSVMLITEIPGEPLSTATHLPPETLQSITARAGADLALVNSIAVDGFGWVLRGAGDASLAAEFTTSREFFLQYWPSDLAFLAQSTLTPGEIRQLERIVARFDPWLDVPQATLAHGDIDATHIYHRDGQYSGIIDFGEIRGTDRYFDLAHFHIRDGERLPHRLLPALLRGYGDVSPLPADHMTRLRFASLLLNVGLLARSLQKRPANIYTDHQLTVLRDDLGAFAAQPLP